MKKLFTLFLFSTILSTGHSQFTPVLIQDNLPLLDDEQFGFISIAHHQQNIYIALYSQGKILKIDTSIQNPQPTEFLIGINNPIDLFVSGNDLYYVEYANEDFQKNSGKISKINLNSGSTSSTVLAQNLNFPYKIAVKDNWIYLSKSDLTEIENNLDYVFNGSELIKIDLNTNSQTSIQEFDWLQDLEFHGNNLYIFELLSEDGEIYEDSRFMRFNTLNNEFSTYYHSNFNWLENISISGDRLYSEIEFYESVSYFDLTSTNHTPQTLAQGGFVYHGEEAYPLIFATTPSIVYTIVYTAKYDNNGNYIGDKYLLYKVTDENMNVQDLKEDKISIYPNPAKESLYLLGIQKASAYSIYDLTGKKIFHGTTDGKISIESIQRGTYLLNIENQRIKFIKK